MTSTTKFGLHTNALKNLAEQTDTHLIQNKLQAQELRDYQLVEHKVRVADFENLTTYELVKIYERLLEANPHADAIKVNKNGEAYLYFEDRFPVHIPSWENIIGQAKKIRLRYNKRTGKHVLNLKVQPGVRVAVHHPAFGKIASLISSDENISIPLNTKYELLKGSILTIKVTVLMDKKDLMYFTQFNEKKLVHYHISFFLYSKSSGLSAISLLK